MHLREWFSASAIQLSTWLQMLCVNYAYIPESKLFSCTSAYIISFIFLTLHLIRLMHCWLFFSHCKTFYTTVIIAVNTTKTPHMNRKAFSRNYRVKACSKAQKPLCLASKFYKGLFTVRNVQRGSSVPMKAFLSLGVTHWSLTVTQCESCYIFDNPQGFTWTFGFHCFWGK